ncbi:MAG TPA: hypothetical protein VEH84_09080 [Alphaproteobacteria bacterium]|nr:hypothetical protein [Alphaproteobacteria bacterium]
MAAPEMSRQAVLERYRLCSEIRRRLQTAALDLVPDSTLVAQARRLGLVERGEIVVNDEDELTLLYDLAVYAPAGRRRRAIDRYARSHPAAPGSEEERVLAALRASWFSFVRVEGRHPVAGLRLADLLSGNAVWLVDESLESSAAPGLILAARLAPFDPFAITCGVLVPLGPETLREILDVLGEGRSKEALVELAKDPRFAESVYRIAVELGLSGAVAYR